MVWLPPLALALACGAAPARTARLDESGVDATIRLRAPAQCGTSEALANRVEARIRRDAFVESARAEVEIEVVVEWAPAGPVEMPPRAPPVGDATPGEPVREGASDDEPDAEPPSVAPPPGIWRAEITTRARPSGEELGRRTLKAPGDECEALRRATNARPWRLRSRS